MGVEVSEMKRGTRSRQIGIECLGLEENVKCEDTAIEEKRPSRATRSKKEEIGGDSFQELEMVLNQGRKSRAMKKKTEQKPQEMEARNEDVEDEKGCSETSDNEDERVEQVEIESRKREDMYCSVGEDGEAENLQDLIDKERDCKSEEAVTDTSDEKAEEGYRNEEKVDLEKIALGDWFKYMEVHLRRKMVDETEEMIEAMRAKSQRVHQHIAEQKQAK
ncbi:LOW QUALITY PROTEIN: hypothetical protein Bca101_021974 [Brassica carinata]